ncbi:MAG: hypothetical protein KGH65_01115 [Candidatus Micrarchaeota archaeon]|nr:hypothetical protein [Candidatus Micrarchaeota archaeon]
MLTRIENRQLAHILVLFLIVQFGGMLLASLLFSTAQASALTGSSTSAINSASQTFYYFGSIIIFALLLVLLIRFYKGELLFILLEALAVVLPSFFFFLIILGYLFPSADFNPLAAISILLAVLLIYAKNKRPSLRNAVVVISSIGLGVILGISFGFAAAFLFMGLIAIYDYVAVFVTKHMITFAKALSSRNLAFLISASDIEVESQSSLQGKYGAVYKKHLVEMRKIDNPTIQRLIKSGQIPIIAQIQLGAGDLGLPLMLAVSAYSVLANYFLSFVIILGGAAGLIATMLFLRKYMRPLPAIPPLFAFICIALGLALPFTAVPNLALSALLIAAGVFIVVFVMYLTLRMGLRADKQKHAQNKS